eukprot:3062870-Ditylum_brightwellii.AAC.1
MEPNFNLNKNALCSRKIAAIALNTDDESNSPTNTVITKITQNSSQNVYSQEQIQPPTGQITENVVTLDILERRLAAFRTDFQKAQDKKFKDMKNELETRLANAMTGIMATN